MEIAKVVLNKNTFNDSVEEAQKKLIGDEKTLIPIPKTSIGVKTSKLPQEIPAKSGLYAIWSNNDLMYVGEVGDKLKLTGRLKQHLFSCSTSTASKLENVINENKDPNKQIKVSMIHVEPVPFRLALEDEIIRIATGDKKAPWNKRSASAGEKKKWILDKIKKTTHDVILAMVNGNEEAARKLVRQLKPKNTIPEDILESQFVEEYGKTTSYDEIIKTLISEKRIVRTPNGIEVVQKRKQKRKS